MIYELKGFSEFMNEKEVLKLRSGKKFSKEDLEQGLLPLKGKEYGRKEIYAQIEQLLDIKINDGSFQKIVDAGILGKSTTRGKYIFTGTENANSKGANDPKEVNLDDMEVGAGKAKTLAKAGVKKSLKYKIPVSSKSGKFGKFVETVLLNMINTSKGVEKGSLLLKGDPGTGKCLHGDEVLDVKISKDLEKTIKYIRKLESKGIYTKPLEYYIKHDVKILHRCVCGNEWLSTPDNIFRGSTCGCKQYKNNESYLLELKKLNIEVEPLEEYKGIKTKIKHKCVCGNEWMVSPEMVKRGTQCGCKKIKIAHENYLEKLANKNIVTKPLEEYIDSYTKIKHKCICGNEWMVSPHDVMLNNSCGCKKTSGWGRKRFEGEKTILYYIKLEGTNIYKVGITLYDSDYTPEDKIKRRLKENKIEIIDYKIYEDGGIAWDDEKKCHKENTNKYKGDKLVRTGNKELYINEVEVKTWK